MNLPHPYNSIMVLGPTASGKTKLAVKLAEALQAEVISADSRQVYRELNIGSGKDLEEYSCNGYAIPYHLIDICNLDIEFTLSDYIKVANEVISELSQKNVTPIICGGSGLYLETFLKEFELGGEPVSKDLRLHLEMKSIEELRNGIEQHPKYLGIPNLLGYNRLRLIRLTESLSCSPINPIQSTVLHPFIIGIYQEREWRWQRIQDRLDKRLNEGMIEEVELLIKNGISLERLQRLGLEYKFISKYLLKEVSMDEMKSALFFEIRRFSKRQMTYFRKLEKDGHSIFWLDGSLSLPEQFDRVINYLMDKK